MACFPSNSSSQIGSGRPNAPIRSKSFFVAQNGENGVNKYRNVLWRCNLTNDKECFDSSAINGFLPILVEELEEKRKAYVRLRRKYIDNKARKLRNEVYHYVREPNKEIPRASKVKQKNRLRLAIHTRESSLQLQETTSFSTQWGLFSDMNITPKAQDNGGSDGELFPCDGDFHEPHIDIERIKQNMHDDIPFVQPLNSFQNTSSISVELMSPQDSTSGQYPSSDYGVPLTLLQLGECETHPLMPNFDEIEKQCRQPEEPNSTPERLYKKDSYKKDKKQWISIMKDVERTLQKRSEFHNLKIKYILSNILFIWSQENEAIGYQQGMNELVALILVALCHDCDQLDEAHPFDVTDNLERIAEFKCLEPDVYTLFDLLIKKLKGFYIDESLGDKQYWRCGVLQDLHHDTMTKKLFHIHHRLLRYLDLTLYNHLRRLQVHPQHYLFKWVRLLLCREFDVYSSLKIWDCLFSESDGDLDFRFLDYLCVALIHMNRAALLNCNTMDVVSILQNQDKEWIETLDVSLLCEKAKEFKFEFENFNKNKLPALKECVISQVMSEFNCTSEDSWPPQVISNEQNAHLMTKCIKVQGLNALSEEKSDQIKWWISSHYGKHFELKDGSILREGYLVKQGGGTTIFGRKNYKRRWIVIDGNELAYFKNKKSSKPQRDWVSLPGRKVTVHSLKYFSFSLSGLKEEDRSILFFAQNEKEFFLWIHALMLACENVEFFTI